MASNFQIKPYNFDNFLFLRLTGDFDEDSAQELTSTLTQNSTGFSDIYLETNELKTVFSFNRDVFQKNLDSIKKRVENLIIIGLNKYKIIQNQEQLRRLMIPVLELFVMNETPVWFAFWELIKSQSELLALFVKTTQQG